MKLNFNVIKELKNNLFLKFVDLTFIEIDFRLIIIGNIK